jgi:hypothetical protein
MLGICFLCSTHHLWLVGGVLIATPSNRVVSQIPRPTTAHNTLSGFTGVGGLRLPKVLKNTINMFP